MAIIQKYNPISGNFDFVHSESSFPTVVANYSALPAVGTVTGQYYWVKASQGTAWLPGSLGGTYYSAGLYYSNGVTWEFLDVPYQATQATVNTGTNTDQFVTPATLTSATVITNKATLVQLQNSADKYAVATGTDTYSITLSPAPTAYATGQTFWVKIPNVNATTTPSLNVNTLGPITILSENGAAIPIKQFVANGNYCFIYDGANFILQGSLTDRKSLGYYWHTGTADYERWFHQTAIGSTVGSTARAKDILVLVPLIVEKTITLDRIGCEVTGAGTAGSVVRLGIYKDTGNMYPDGMVINAGTIAGDSATVQSINISQQLVPGLYWLVYWHNSVASISFRTLTATASFMGLPSTIGVNVGNVFTLAAVYSATLPDPFTAGGGMANQATPIISFRLSA